MVNLTLTGEWVEPQGDGVGAAPPLANAYIQVGGSKKARDLFSLHCL